MHRLFGALAHPPFLIDLGISLLALAFMCALIYSMRWMPGKAAACSEPIAESEEQASSCVPDKAGSAGRLKPAPLPLSTKAGKELLTADE